MAEPEGWVRLHPLSPLLNAGRYLFLAVLLTFQAWADQLFEAAPGATLILRVGGALVVVGLLALGYSMIAWRFAMCRMTAEIIEFKTGILFRSYRHLPFERIESVDTAQPLIPRLLGLAEVRVEAISKKGSELRLRYLSLEDAERLRLELSARRRSDTSPPSETEVSLILKVPARELVMGYVLIPAVTAAAAVIPVVAVVGLVAGWQEALFVVLIGLLTGLAGVVPVLVRLERLWDFRLDDADHALVVNRGLLNLNTQRILTGRIQALRVDQPLLWRPFKRFRVVVDVAGYRGAGNEAAAAAANLLPIAPYDVVRYLVHRLDMRVDLAALPFEPVPRRARWRSFRWRGFKVAWTDSHAIVQSGVFWRRTAVVPHQRIQSARVTQGPWQRRLRLATVRLDTAGSRIKAAAAHRDEREATELAQKSARRARQTGADLRGSEAPRRAVSIDTEPELTRSATSTAPRGATSSLVRAALTAAVVVPSMFGAWFALRMDETRDRPYRVTAVLPVASGERPYGLALDKSLQLRFRNRPGMNVGDPIGVRYDDLGRILGTTRHGQYIPKAEQPPKIVFILPLLLATGFAAAAIGLSRSLGIGRLPLPESADQGRRSTWAAGGLGFLAVLWFLALFQSPDTSTLAVGIIVEILIALPLAFVVVRLCRTRRNRDR